MRKLLLLCVIVSALALAATPAAADAKQGLYIGGSVGQSYYDIQEGSEFNLDDSDFAWKAFLGYRFGLFAIEGDYRDFGTVQSTTGGTSYKIGTQAFDVAAQLMLPIGPFDVIAKVGASAWDSDPEVDGVSFDDITSDGTNLMYGVGAQFRLGAIGIRLEIEQFDVDPDPIDMISVGASFTF